MDELYREYSQIVFFFLYKRCGDALLSEDLMQETFLKAIESIDSYDGSCKMSTWLCQIAKHLLYQHWEKDKHMPTEELNNEYESCDDTEQQAIAKIELADVWNILYKLPLETRKVVELRVLGGLSFKEIGEILKISENNARVTFFRAKMTLIKEVHYGED